MSLKFGEFSYDNFGFFSAQVDAVAPPLQYSVSVFSPSLGRYIAVASEYSRNVSEITISNLESNSSLAANTLYALRVIVTSPDGNVRILEGGVMTSRLAYQRGEASILGVSSTTATVLLPRITLSGERYTAHRVEVLQRLESSVAADELAYRGAPGVYFRRWAPPADDWQDTHPTTEAFRIEAKLRDGTLNEHIVGPVSSQRRDPRLCAPLTALLSVAPELAVLSLPVLDSSGQSVTAYTVAFGGVVRYSGGGMASVPINGLSPGREYVLEIALESSTVFHTTVFKLKTPELAEVPNAPVVAAAAEGGVSIELPAFDIREAAVVRYTVLHMRPPLGVEREAQLYLGAPGSGPSLSPTLRYTAIKVCGV